MYVPQSSGEFVQYYQSQIIGTNGIGLKLLMFTILELKLRGYSANVTFHSTWINVVKVVE